MSVKSFISGLFVEKPSANVVVKNIADDHSNHIAAHISALGGGGLTNTSPTQVPQTYSQAAQNALQNNIQGLQQQLNANMYGTQNVQQGQYWIGSGTQINQTGLAGQAITYQGQQPFYYQPVWYADPKAVQARLDTYSIETQNLYKELHKLDNNILSHNLLTEQCDIIETHFKNNKFKNKLENIINE